MNPKQYKPLDEDKQKIAESYMPLVCKIANEVWRSSHLSAWHCEELKSEALYELCLSIAKFKETPEWTIGGFIAWRVRKHLWGVVRAWWGEQSSEIGDSEIQEDLGKDELTDREKFVFECVAYLKEKPRKAIEHIYGLVGPEQSKTDIAQSLDITKQLLYQREKLGLMQLRQLIGDELDELEGWNWK